MDIEWIEWNLPEFWPLLYEKPLLPTMTESRANSIFISIREAQGTVTQALPLEAREHDSPFLSIAMQPLKSYLPSLTLVASTVYGGTDNALLAKKHKVGPDDFIKSFLAPNYDRSLTESNLS